MQGNTRPADAGQPRASSVRPGGETKQVRKTHIRKIPYRVGYSWNKGGRLKELRIRHLARKFLRIWRQNTFGRVPLHKAMSHHDSVVQRRAFGGWRDEWWTSRREWSLTMRAECHYRYYLCNLAFHSWRTFTSMQREKKSKVQNAQLYADRQRMGQALDRWEVFTEMRRMKTRMLESACELNRLATLHSAWSLWQSRLQQRRDLYALEDQALKQQALTLQRKAWLRWKGKHTASCCQREKESKASLHFILRLKRKTLHRWKTYVSRCQTQRRSQAAAQRACHLRLVRMCWSNWRNALHRRWSEEDRLQAAGQLATQSIQRRALERWKACILIDVTLCRDKAEINQMASQHRQHHLLSAGLQGLSLNIIVNKTHRLNNNMAVQHYNQTMIRKFWRLWQDRLEEAEDRGFQGLTEKAQANYSTSLLSSCFRYWREKLAGQRHVQELEHRADVWFAERVLPRRFNSWAEFTLRRRLRHQRRHEAEVYNQRRQYTWVFYTWWGRSERHKEQMLSERMAILHEERCRMQGAWARWRQRTERQISEGEKREASDRLYLRRLLRKTLAQWRDNSAEIRDRRNRERRACHQGDLRCMKWALEKWKKFVQRQRVKRRRLEEMQRHHEAKLLTHTLVAWKTQHLQMSHICRRAEDLYRQRTQRFLRAAVSAWRENAALQAEGRLMEQQAQDHFQHSLQLKVFLAWREGTRRAVSKRHQQAEAVSRAQRSMSQVRLLRSFRRWRKHTREARRERMCMEKARRHHNSQILSKALNAWNKHHCQYQRYKVMKRQGILLLRLKMCQTYFEQWKIKLQHRRREVKQTERALWHWSLTLQAKVLRGWRLWAGEQRGKRERAARAALVYRDQLLREGVTCILTYAAHMNDLTASLAPHSREPGSRHLQRVVKRCAMRWKRRALCKPGGQPQKKSVTFRLTGPGLESVSSPDPVGQDADGGVAGKLPPTRLPRRQPRCCEVDKPPLTVWPHEGSQNRSGIASPEAAQETQDLLLPPSAFMTTGPRNMLGQTSSSGSGDASPAPFHQFVAPIKHDSRCPEIHLRASGEETEGLHVDDVLTDPASVLTRELLIIQLDMKDFQQDRKQLRAWQKLKEVLQSWLQTSGEDEQVEKASVCQELKELEERIDRLSADLAERRPAMLLHAERVRRLQSVLRASGVASLCRKTRETETRALRVHDATVNDTGP